MVVKLAIQDGVARLTLASEATGNAIDAALVDGLHAALQQALAEPGLRAVVIAASGPVFCSGLALGKDVPAEAIDRFRGCLAAIVEAAVPVIACVDGAAWGGG